MRRVSVEMRDCFRRATLKCIGRDVIYQSESDQVAGSLPFSAKGRNRLRIQPIRDGRNSRKRSFKQRRDAMIVIAWCFTLTMRQYSFTANCTIVCDGNQACPTPSDAITYTSATPCPLLLTSMQRGSDV